MAALSRLSVIPLLASLAAAQDPRPNQSLGNPAHVVGPLLIANALTWGLWGILSFQLYLFVVAAAREDARTRNESDGSAVRNPSPQCVRKSNEVTNPWMLDVVQPTPNPPALSINTQSHRSQNIANKLSRDNRLSEGSLDPYAYHSSAYTSPVTAEDAQAEKFQQFPQTGVAAGGIAHFPTQQQPSASYPTTQTLRTKLSSLFSSTPPPPPLPIAINASSSAIDTSMHRRSLALSHVPVFMMLMLRSSFVRFTAYGLYLLVCAQVVVGTAYVWGVVVDGWTGGLNARDSNRDPGDGRLLAASADILGALVFLLSMAFFAYRLLILPSLVPTTNSTMSSDMRKRTGAGKFLRPLSLVMKNGLASEKADELRQQDRSGTGAGPHTFARGGGHVELVPTWWERIGNVGKAVKDRFVIWYRGAVSSVGRTGEKMVGLERVFGSLSLVLVGIALVFTVVVGICGVVIGAQAVKNPLPLGVPMTFDGGSAIWKAGSVILNAFVCGLMLSALVRTRGLHFLYASRLVCIMRGIGESGMALFVVAVLELVLSSAVSGSTRSTISMVPGLVLPTLYANTVFLNVTHSYCGFALYSSPIVSFPKTEKGQSSSATSSVFAAKKGKECDTHEDIEMGIRGISHAALPQQVVKLNHTENNSSSSGDTNTSVPANARPTGAAYVNSERDRDQANQMARMHMERDTFGGTSMGPKAAKASGAGGNNRDHEYNDTIDIAAPIVTPGAAKRSKSISAARRLSNYSQDGLSLDLPVFRKGRRGAYDYAGNYDDLDYDYDDDEDDEDDGSYLSSDEGVAWDYGYSLNLANAERERERDERERATQLAGATDAATMSAIPATGTAVTANGNAPHRDKKEQQGQPFHLSQPLSFGRKSIPSSPLAPYRRNSLQPFRSREDVLLEEGADIKSIRSKSSRRSRSQSRPRRASYTRSIVHSQSYISPLHSHHYSHLYDLSTPGAGPSAGPASENLTVAGAGGHPRAPRLLPPTPGDAPAPAPDDASVLIISPVREPSITELSAFKAASIAATRASTGSQWSSYTYPKPIAFPDLDEDLQHRVPSGYRYDMYRADGTGTGMGSVMGEGTGEGQGQMSFAEYDPDETESMRDAKMYEEQDLGDALAYGGMGRMVAGGNGSLGTLMPSQSAHHPYASAALEADEMDIANESERRQREEENRRRRWRVHPLKRMVEMGRLKF